MRNVYVPLARQLARNLPITILDLVSPFNPSSLFAASEDGGWWDVSDLTSLRVGRNGSGGQPAATNAVGLVLDKRLMGGRTAAAFIENQPELITNGTFDTDSDWIKAGTWTIASGVANRASFNGYNAFTSSDLAIALDKFYVVSFDMAVSGTSAAPFEVRLGTTVGPGKIGDVPTGSSSGRYSFIAKPVSGGSVLTLVAWPLWEGTIDNVSVREIPGNHLVAPSDAARPVLGASALTYDDVDDDMRINLPAISGGTVGVVYDDRLITWEINTAGGDYRIPRYGWDAVLIIDRAFTAGEIAELESYYSATHEAVDFHFALRNELTANMRHDTTGSVNWVIDWGDGTVETVASAATETHTYGSAYSGPVVTTSAAAMTRVESHDGNHDYNFADLPSGLTIYSHTGSNTVSSSLADLPSGVTSYSHGGFNTVSGSLADLPSGLTSYNHTGSNTVSGSLADLPSGVTYYNHIGSNTVSGSLADLPSGLTIYSHTGFNTVSGSLADLPSGLTSYHHGGFSAVSGSLADLPSGLTLYSQIGPNTVSGSLADLPSGLTYYDHRGSNTTVPGGSAWATTLQYVRLDGALTSGEVDTLLTNLSAVTTWTGSRTIELRNGSNAARTSASDAAVTTLQGNGVTVNTA